MKTILGRLIGLAVAGTLLLSCAACNGNSGGTTSGTAASATAPSAGASPTASATITDKVKDEDTDATWDDATATHIAANGTTVTITGDGATASGTTVTITAAGTYVVSGSLDQGQILINATKQDLVRLVLNGVNITADKNSAIYDAVADKLVVILAPGTDNTLTDSASYTYADATAEEPDATLFSKDDLSITGTGNLTVNGNFQYGINTKDDLVVSDANITIASVSAALRGKDSVTILGGSFTLTSQNGDGIKSTNDTDANKGWVWIQGGTFQINAYNDGIQAATILQVDNGTFTITSGGGWPGGSLKRGSHAANNDGVVSGTNPTTGSYKGLKGGQAVIINGGAFDVSAYDDAIHSSGDVTINGGDLTLHTGDDGVHADTTLTVNGGSITVVWSYEGLEGAAIALTGGTISVMSTDDGINGYPQGSGLIAISGGDISVNSGGDGLDSNGNLSLTGGTVHVDGPTTSQNGAIDYGDSNNYFNIDGGTIVAVDAQQNEAPSSSSTQPSLYIRFTSTQAAGTEFSLRDAAGNTIIDYTPSKAYLNVVASSPNLQPNSTYSLYSGDTKLTNVTLSSMVTSIDSNGNAFTQGGFGGPGAGGAPGARPGGR